MFDVASGSGTPMDQLFFGTRTSGEGTVGVYLELYYEAASRSLSVCSFAYVAADDSYSEERAGALKQFQFADFVQPEVRLSSPTVLGSAYWFSILLSLHEDTEEHLRLIDAQAQLHKNYSATYAFNNLKVLPASFPSRKQNLRVRGKLLADGRFFCPNCFGHGVLNTMAISKTDWESGATGYALYSCNQANGRVACHVCGGSGGDYLPWYLDEHPELVGVTLTPGSGLLPSQAD